MEQSINYYKYTHGVLWQQCTRLSPINQLLRVELCIYNYYFEVYKEAIWVNIAKS